MATHAVGCLSQNGPMSHPLAIFVACPMNRYPASLSYYRSWATASEPGPSIHQVALLPAGFGAPAQIGNVSVVTWEQVADTFRDVAPAY